MLSKVYLTLRGGVLTGSFVLKVKRRYLRAEEELRETLVYKSASKFSCGSPPTHSERILFGKKNSNDEGGRRGQVSPAVRERGHHTPFPPPVYFWWLMLIHVIEVNMGDFSLSDVANMKHT